MRTYDERIMNIRAKAKATKKAYRAITASLVTLSLFAVVIGGMLLHPELFLRIGKEPTYGPALQQPSGNYSPMDDPVMTHPTMMGPTSPEDVIGFQVNDLKLHSGEDWGFGPVVIRSVEELELFCDRQAALYNDWPSTLSKPIDSIVELTAKYDNTFFARQSLILLMKPEGSGSNKLQVTEVFWMDSDSVMVTVDRILPGIGTADMAYWYLFIETDEVLPESADVWVQYSINRESWQEPAYDRMQIPVKTQRIYYGAPDMDAKYPRTDVIASVEELQAYLAGLDADLSVETQQYDAAFFETHTLLALWNPVGSSSVEYYVNEVWRMSDGGISIRGQCTSPTFCNEDIMSWLIFIEAEADISHYAKIFVDYTAQEETDVPETETPSETIMHAFVTEEHETMFYSDGSCGRNMLTTYTRAEDGTLLSKAHSNSGSFPTVYTAEYDDAGMLIRMYSDYSDIRYSYDSYGNVAIKEIWSTTNGYRISKVLYAYKYDKMGRVLSCQFTEDEINRRTEYSYYENGVMKEQREYYNDVMYEKTQYLQNGKPDKRYAYSNTKGQLLWTESYYHDGNNGTAKRVGVGGAVEYRKYIYDDYGNVLKMTYENSDKMVYTTTYTYMYVEDTVDVSVEYYADIESGSGASKAEQMLVFRSRDELIDHFGVDDEVCAEYTDQFFVSNSLIYITFSEFTGQARHQVVDVRKDEQDNYRVMIDHIYPEVCTDDMGSGVIFITVREKIPENASVLVESTPRYWSTEAWHELYSNHECET